MKPFEELELDIVLPGRCFYCGACGAFCPYNYIHYENERPVSVDCRHCGNCYDVCPSNYFSVTRTEKSIFGERRRDEILGYYRRIVSGRAVDEEIRKNAQDGGCVTALLCYMMDEGVIDSAVVVGRDDNWNPIPFVAKNKEVLLSARGSKYNQVPLLLAVKKAEGKFAFVGLPCHVKAVRNAQSLGLVNPEIVFGLFCMETFTRSEFLRKLEEFGVNVEDVKKFDVKGGKLIAYLNGDVKEVPLKELKSAMRPGCKYCDDFTAEFADVSFGSVGSDDGWNTVIVRSERGERLLEDAVRKGYLELGEVNVEEVRKLADSKKRRLVRQLTP